MIAISGIGTNIEIECKRFWRSEEQAQEDYKTIMNGIFHHVIPGLADRIAARIRQGNSYDLGSIKLSKSGVYMKTGALMWEKEHNIPWTDVRYGTNQGTLTVRSNTNPKANAQFSIRDVWNAAIFELIVNKI